MRITLSLPAVARVRPAVADAFHQSANQVYSLIETEFAFPGDFVIIHHATGRRFAIMTDDGAQLPECHLRPFEYQIIGRAVPLDTWPGVQW